jgi:hypothetical protein
VVDDPAEVVRIISEAHSMNTDRKNFLDMT